VETDLRSLFELPPSEEVVVNTTILRGDGEEQKVPFNEMWVPILLFTDTALIGMVFIAALLFMEKEEGTLRAFLVTPGHSWEYLLSKTLTLALLAALFTLIFVPLTIGAGPNYLYLLLLMAAGSLFGSLLGAWVAVYFDNLSQYLFPALTLMVVLSLPAVAYFTPSFSPWWLRLFPTYPLVFGLREALFPSGSPQIVFSALSVLLGLSLLLLVISSRVFKRQLARA
jgi:ABC-type Na+ efflux pump permease subunit